jgi:membrane-associated phospholipid phosphatase
VAGEPSGAFWTLAPAAVVPPQWRALAYGAALTFGAAVGVLRIVAGAHFFSDVVFAGVFSFLVIWLVHGLLYRWRHTRTSDAAVDGVLERMIMSQRAVLMRIRSGRRDPASAGTSDQQRKD